MKKATFVLILLLVSLASNAKESSIDNKLYQLLCEQVDAFNNQDVDVLVNNVSEDFKWYSLTSDELLPSN